MDGPGVAAVNVFHCEVRGVGTGFLIRAGALRDRAYGRGGALREGGVAGGTGAIRGCVAEAHDVVGYVAMLDARAQHAALRDLPVRAGLGGPGLDDIGEAEPGADALKAVVEIPVGLGVEGPVALHRLQAPRARTSEAEGELPVDRMKVSEIKRRLLEFRAQFFRRAARAAVERESGVAVGDEVDLIIEDRALRLKATFADDIDGTADAVGGLVGHGGLVDFDARDVGHRDVEEGLHAAVAPGAGEVRAVELHHGVALRETAQRHGAGGLTAVNDADTGQESHEFADAFRVAIPKLVESDDLLDVGGAPALVLRDSLGAHLAVGDDVVGCERDDGTRGGGAGDGEIEIALRDGGGGDRHDSDSGFEADIGHGETRFAGRHPREAIGTEVVGFCGELRALEDDAGGAEGAAGGGVEDAALDRARGDGLRASVDCKDESEGKRSETEGGLHCRETKRGTFVWGAAAIGPSQRVSGAGADELLPSVSHSRLKRASVMRA